MVASCPDNLGSNPLVYTASEFPIILKLNVPPIKLDLSVIKSKPLYTDMLVTCIRGAQELRVGKVASDEAP